MKVYHYNDQEFEVEYGSSRRLIVRLDLGSVGGAIEIIAKGKLEGSREWPYVILESGREYRTVKEAVDGACLSLQLKYLSEAAYEEKNRQEMEEWVTSLADWPSD